MIKLCHPKLKEKSKEERRKEKQQAHLHSYDLARGEQKQSSQAGLKHNSIHKQSSHKATQLYTKLPTKEDQDEKMKKQGGRNARKGEMKENPCSARWERR